MQAPAAINGTINMDLDKTTFFSKKLTHL